MNGQTVSIKALQLVVYNWYVRVVKTGERLVRYSIFIPKELNVPILQLLFEKNRSELGNGFCPGNC